MRLVDALKIVEKQKKEKGSVGFSGLLLRADKVDIKGSAKKAVERWRKKKTR